MVGFVSEQDVPASLFISHSGKERLVTAFWRDYLSKYLENASLKKLFLLCPLTTLRPLSHPIHPIPSLSIPSRRPVDLTLLEWKDRRPH